MVEELVAHVREAFGWGADVVVSEGPRGALGQIWRLDVGPARYALKEIFAEPPSETLIEAELAFARRAAEVGVRLRPATPTATGATCSRRRAGRGCASMTGWTCGRSS